MCLLSRVERYLKLGVISPTRFGREAVGDPNFVRDLRNGRAPGKETIARVSAFIARAEHAFEKPPCKG